jgi:hypothetical protein
MASDSGFVCAKARLAEPKTGAANAVEAVSFMKVRLSISFPFYRTNLNWFMKFLAISLSLETAIEVFVGHGCGLVKRFWAKFAE